MQIYLRLLKKVNKIIDKTKTEQDRNKDIINSSIQCTSQKKYHALATHTLYYYLNACL